jgi:hypothetical protein
MGDGEVSSQRFGGPFNQLRRRSRGRSQPRGASLPAPWGFTSWKIHSMLMCVESCCREGGGGIVVETCCRASLPAQRAREVRFVCVKEREWTCAGGVGSAIGSICGRLVHAGRVLVITARGSGTVGGWLVCFGGWSSTAAVSSRRAPPAVAARKRFCSFHVLGVPLRETGYALYYYTIILIVRYTI